MANPGNPNLAEARKLAASSPNTGKHGKAKKTLLKEEIIREGNQGLIRAYRGELLERFPTIRRVRLQEAEKPKNVQERKYVFEDVEKAAGIVDSKKVGDNTFNTQLNVSVRVEKIKEFAKQLGDLIEESWKNDR